MQLTNENWGQNTDPTDISDICVLTLLTGFNTLSSILRENTYGRMAE